MHFTQERRLPRDPRDWTGWWHPYLRPWPWLLAIVPALSYAIGIESPILFVLVLAFLCPIPLLLPGHPFVTAAAFVVAVGLLQIPDRFPPFQAQPPGVMTEVNRQWVEAGAIAVISAQLLVIAWALVTRRRPDPVMTITRNR